MLEVNCRACGAVLAFSFLLLLAGAVQPVTATTEQQQEESSQQTLVHTFRLPLEDGQVHCGELVGKLVEMVGLESEQVESLLDFRIDVSGAVGQLKLDQLERVTRGIISFRATPAELVVTADRIKLRREERAIRKKIRDWIEILNPRAAAAAAKHYGIHCVVDSQTRISPTSQTVTPHVVILVHGLDEPGQIWNATIPALQQEGYTVCELTYPNDQGIDESAVFLYDQLKTLHTLGVRNVDLVAHSMGGLVSRELLTHPKMYAGDGAGPGTGAQGLPAIDRLIMIGTPNHGSEIARIRVASEWREQISRMLSGDGLLFGGVFDGAGEAGIDLLPESDFLVALNSRPLPTNVHISIVAGIASPVSDERLDSLSETLTNLVGEEQSQTVQDIRDLLTTVSDGIGDGCVSLKSASLEGVDDFTVVNDNHITMLGNLINGSQRIPPAVPIILDRLGK